MKLLEAFGGGYEHVCPGCNQTHFIPVEKPMSNGSQWTFNGDMEKPTFSPSVRIRINKEWRSDPNAATSVCHYFIRDGQIEYCGDSTHSLAGKVVPLPVLNEA